MKQPKEEAQEIPGINWIASYPKSGNTWLRLLFYVYIEGKFNKLNQTRKFTCGDMSLPHWMSSSVIPWGLLSPERKNLVRYSALMSIIMHYANESAIFCKTHCANLKYNSLDLIPSELSSKSIYILRDPRDVVHSYAHHMGYTLDEAIESMSSKTNALAHPVPGADIVQPLSTWSEHVTSWLNNGEFERCALRYEDLVVDTEGQFTELVEFIFGKVKPKKVKKAVKHTEFKNLKSKEEKQGFGEASKNGEFFRQGKIEAWKNILTTKQVVKIEQDHGEVMEKLGYKLEYL